MHSSHILHQDTHVIYSWTSRLPSQPLLGPIPLLDLYFHTSRFLKSLFKRSSTFYIPLLRIIQAQWLVVFQLISMKNQGYISIVTCELHKIYQQKL